MSITKLSEGDREKIDKDPEVAMNIQIARRRQDYVVVVSGRIAIVYDESIISQLNRLNEVLRGPADDADASYANKLEQWTEALPTSAPLTSVPVSEALAVLKFIHLGPRYPFPAPPPASPILYGHLPFQGLSSGQEIFYRYETYPTSRRINRKTNKVNLPNTYASPERDADFVNSGLGAVARYALPQLLPARWRYELRPPPGTTVNYGASVPLYGQSGGGVEVSFPSPFTNSGSIPPPVVLPIF
jgi:hypothetical protein